ncbi:MAG: helix-turn-helix domain-containing protein [Myxococcota bacterium]
MRSISTPSEMPALLSEFPRAVEPYRVHCDGDWFDIPGGSRVSCRHRTHLRRLLKALAHHRVQHPGEPIKADALFAVGWPDERIEQRSARNRLKVAMSTLRKMGFGATLLGDRDGYRLKQEIPVEVVRPMA